jgi:hypothetical protein
MGTEVLAACTKTQNTTETSGNGVIIEAIGAQIETDREVVISYTTGRDVVDSGPPRSPPALASAPPSLHRSATRLGQFPTRADTEAAGADFSATSGSVLVQT